MTEYGSYWKWYSQTKLKPLYEQLTDELEQKVYLYLCYCYKQYNLGLRATKYVSKEDMIKHLINCGLMHYSEDKKTGEKKLPDDRKLREVCRTLLFKGYPVMASSKHSGWYIADTLEEIQQPKEENEKRAKMILAANNGYNKVARLIQYDTRLS
jgi:hypothetical protein